MKRLIGAMSSAIALGLVMSALPARAETWTQVAQQTSVEDLIRALTPTRVMKAPPKDTRGIAIGAGYRPAPLPPSTDPPVSRDRRPSAERSREPDAPIEPKKGPVDHSVERTVVSRPTTVARTDARDRDSDPTARTRANQSGVCLEAASLKPEEGSGAVDLFIYFEFKSADISPQSRPEIKRLAQALMSPELSTRAFVLEGHTDAVGSPEANRVLSRRRAEAVRDYLSEFYDIDPSRLQVAGHGEDALRDPANPNSCVNRRVAVVTQL